MSDTEEVRLYAELLWWWLILLGAGGIPIALGGIAGMIMRLSWGWPLFGPPAPPPPPPPPPFEEWRRFAKLR
jgi:hypothetical protein